MKKNLVMFLVIFLFGIFVPTAKATYNPTVVPNNHFGIHVADTSDLKDAAKLVNSNGGDFGYVTFVIQKGERDTKRWQNAFDEMRRLHLIPIVRLATAPAGNSNIWEKPSIDEIDGWVSFLNSLNWVIKNRYVIIGNEVNHASEWGGEINPAEYSNYLQAISTKLKAANNDFFIMASPFDASAITQRSSLAGATMEESLYLSLMVQSNPHVFDNIDGLASHSYPNPDFSGSGDGYGKGSVRTFVWELNYLKYLGVSKNLPVFITETGWSHDPVNLITNIGPKIETAFKNAWSDKRVVAVTPFIFKYTGPPFDNFSWVNKDGQFFDFYDNVLNLAKVRGEPIQESKALIITGVFPRIAMAGGGFRAIIFMKNIGQSIWNAESLKFRALGIDFNLDSMYPKIIEPNEIGIFILKGEFPQKPGIYNLNLQILEKGQVFNEDFKTTTDLISNLPNIGDIINYLKIAIPRKISMILGLRH